MTPIFCCGFECGVSDSTIGAIGPHWSALTPSASFSTSTVRTGARSLRINPSADNGYATTIGVTGGTVRVIRVYVRFSTLPNAKIQIVGDNLRGAGAWFNSADSKIYAGVTTTGTLGATGVSVTTGVWYRIDVNVNVASNPWTVDVQVDGTACGQATNSVAGSTLGDLKVGHVGNDNYTADYYFDDLLASETSADYPIGAGYVNHFVPTADGTHNIAGTGDFQRGNTGVDILNTTTTAYQLIDDVPLPSGTVDQADNQRAVAPPNDTDYVECVFGPAPGISTPTVGPRAVEMVIAYHQIATQNGQMIIELNDNGTVNTMFDTGVAAGVTTYRYARKQYATPPTGGSWGVAAGNGNFNNVRCRFRAPDPAPDQCYDGGMIEAEFAPAVAARTPRTTSIGHPFII